MYQIFLKFLRHIGIFVDHLGGVDTPIGRVLVPRNLAKLSKYMREGEVNISASIGLHAPNLVWRFLRHIGTFLDHLGAVDTPAHRVPVAKCQTKLSKCMGEWGGHYLSFY